MSHTPEASGGSEQAQNIYDFAAQYNFQAVHTMHEQDYHSFWLVDPQTGISPTIERINPQNRAMLNDIYQQLGVNRQRPAYLMQKYADGRWDHQVGYFIPGKRVIIHESEFLTATRGEFRVWATTCNLPR